MTDKRRFPTGRLALLALVVVLVVAGGWAYWIYRHPLAAFVKQARQALEDMGLERVETEVAGKRLVYFRGGEGPLLVLLHGAGDQAGTWATVVPDLLAEYEIVIPDLPGHGGSEPGEGPLPFGTVVSGFEAFLETWTREEPAILVGNSMGAWLAALEAHGHPESVRRAILVNGGPITGDPSNPSLTPSNREEARQLMQMLRDPSSPEIPDFVLDDIVRRSNNGPIGRMLEVPASFGEHLLDGRLGEISTPVDLVWGESDRLMDLDYAERMLEELPRARLTGVPKCGHLPQSECPERFLEILRTVLASEPPAAAPAPELSGESDSAAAGEADGDSR